MQGDVFALPAPLSVSLLSLSSFSLSLSLSLSPSRGACAGVHVLGFSSFMDLNARFSHIGITKFFYVCNPQYKENQLFQPAMKAMAAHFGFEEQTLTEEWRHMLSAKERYLLHYPEKRTALPFLSLVFFPRASMPVLFKYCAKNVQS